MEVFEDIISAWMVGLGGSWGSYLVRGKKLAFRLRTLTAPGEASMCINPCSSWIATVLFHDVYLSMAFAICAEWI